MRNTTAEMIEVIRAYREGKPLQYRRADNDSKDWIDAKFPSPDHAFDFFCWQYRVKPEPKKPREWWLVTDNGRSFDSWKALSAYSCEQKIFDDQVQVHVREVLPDEKEAA